MARAQGAASPVLVSIFLDGGADSLSMLAPVSGAQSGYYNDFRPNLALGRRRGPRLRRRTRTGTGTPTPQPLDDIQRGLRVNNQSTVGMTVFPTIGYTDPDQSHFTSRHYWEVGKLDPNLRTGWMGQADGPNRHRRQPASGPVA